MKLAALLACLAPAVVFGPAAAQEPQPPLAAAPAGRESQVFVGGRVGMYRPSDADDLEPFSFDPGLDLEAFVGFRLNRYVSIEGGIGYYRAATNTLTASDPIEGNLSLDFDMSVLPLTASVRAGGAVDRVTFYGLAGIGLHLTTLEANLASAAVSASLSEDDEAFGWHLGAGLAVAVTPRLSLGAELRRTFVSGEYPQMLGPDALGAPTTELTLDGLRLGATLELRL